MPTQYVTSEGVSLAYQVTGASGPTLLYVPGATSNLVLEEQQPQFRRYLGWLTRFCRVVRFDKRGTGLSDPAGGPLTLAQQVADIDAVLRATTTGPAAIFGISHGAAIGALYAIAHPDRVSHLVIVGGLVCDARDPARTGPGDDPLAKWDMVHEMVEQDFAGYTRLWAELILPEGAPAQVERLTEFLQATSGRAGTKALHQSLKGLDLRAELARLTVPTLIVHSHNDHLISVEHGRWFAQHLPNARYLELDSSAHDPLFDDRVAKTVAAATEEFLTGSATHTADRVVASVLFTDIVDSTALQQQRGDEVWREVRAAFERSSREIVEQFGGRVVQFTGDGIMAAFAAPGDGLRAAQALVGDARAQGIEIRAGLHSGEAYESGDQLMGLCVNMAARVAAEAGAGEVLTTPVVQGLVEGSGFAFADAGEFELKGFGPRRLLRLT